MPDNHTTTVVDRIPDCDICKYAEKRVNPRPAVIDGKTIHGPWANMCASHFETHGVGLGLGRGQRLVLRSNTNTSKEN
jgi:hypothetical protein